ncbi:MAG: hypothetical protein IKS03_06895 [Ruminococcus sp.]|nr:hypothetical protein [Ruminococcus sp.]
MKEKVYVTPEIEITGFDAKDIIATSGDEVHTEPWTVPDTPFLPINS